MSAFDPNIHVPGMWRCAKCAFVLTQSTLHASTGNVSARDEAGDRCPNCDVPLWRLTWRQNAEELHDRLVAMLTTSPWQPIETAPKSTTTPAPGGHHVRGVYLLGFCPEDGPTPEGCISVIWWEPHHHGENRGAWVSEAGFEVRPTKWTRLPAPPVAEVA